MLVILEAHDLLDAKFRKAATTISNFIHFVNGYCGAFREIRVI